jgi:hypothetical protein
MKKLIIIIIFMLILIFNIFPQKLNISDMDISEFVESVKSGKNVDLKVNYLWTGTIVDISKDNADLSVLVLKSDWINKDKLNSYTVILKIKDQKMIEKIKNAGQNKKIVFIVQILEVKDGIPICLPLLIREI